MSPASQGRGLSPMPAAESERPWPCCPGDLFEGHGALGDAGGTRNVDSDPPPQVAEAGPDAFALLRGREPFVMRGLASHWPALSRWSSPGVLAALADSPEDRVLVLRSRDGNRFLKRDCEQERWPMADLAAHLLGSQRASTPGASVYARAPLSARVLSDCALSDIGSIFGERPKLRNCGLWLGSAANVTPFHYDLCHGFLVQVLGAKTFHFVQPEQWRSLYPREGSPELSSVDYGRWSGAHGPEAARLERARHPRFARARLRSVTLEPGDAIYTPPFWWHRVESGGCGPVIASVLVPFDQSAEEAAVGDVCHHFS